MLEVGGLRLVLECGALSMHGVVLLELGNVRLQLPRKLKTASSQVGLPKYSVQQELLALCRATNDSRPSLSASAGVRA